MGINWLIYHNQTACDHLYSILPCCQLCNVYPTCFVKMGSNTWGISLDAWAYSCCLVSCDALYSCTGLKDHYQSCDKGIKLLAQNQYSAYECIM